MHLPDGLIWPPIALLGWIIAILAISMALKRIDRDIPSDRIPVLAVMAAGIFAAQMVNFPIIGGTTGHLIGTALATIMLGPWAAILVMTVVIVIQALIFGDGGVLAIGLNLLNMVLIGVGITWVIMRLTERRSGIAFPTFFAGWIAVVLGAFLLAAELAMSNSVSHGNYGIVWSISLPFLIGSSLLIGLGEGMLSSLVASYIYRVSPEMILSGYSTTEGVSQ